METIEKIRKWLYAVDKEVFSHMIVGMNLEKHHEKFPIYISEDPSYVDKNSSKTEEGGYQEMEVYSYSKDLEQQLRASSFRQDEDFRGFAMEPQERNLKMSLEKYIGVKIIKAEPQDCPKDDYNSKVGDPGYKVQYEDGYISWSPKDVFEKAYRKTDGLSFGLAVEAMRKGLKVKFENWGSVYLEIGEWRGEENIYIHYSISRNEIWWPEQNCNLIDNWFLQDKWQIVD